MKVTLGDVVDAQPGLGGIIGVAQDPVVTFYFVDLFAALKPKILSYNRVLNGVIDELGEPVELGKPQKCIPQNSTAYKVYEEKVTELRSQEVDLPGVVPFHRDRFGRAALKAEWIISLGPFVTKEPSPKKPAP